MTRAGPSASSLLPTALLLSGLLYALTLQGYIREDVFFSGDGGVKFLATAQFARGEWSTELRLPAQAWEEATWRSGFFPFQPPFIYEIEGRHVFGVPLLFCAATAPFYASFGYRGMYVLPLAAFFVLALRTRLLMRRFDLGVEASCLVYGGLLLGSFPTLYSAIFWEHLPATALASLGIATVIEDFQRPAGLRRAGMAGLCVGLSAWLRPEDLCLALIVVVVWSFVAWRRDRWRAWLSFSGVVVVMVAGFMLINLGLYDHPLGTHSFQVLDAAGGRLALAAVHLRSMGWGLLTFSPLSFLLPYFGVRLLRNARTRQAAPFYYALVVTALFLPTLALIVPNEGGLQIGPRYAMAVVPMICWAVGLAWQETNRRAERPERRVLVAAAIGLIVYGVWLNLWSGTAKLARNYRERVLPAIELVRRSDIDQIVVADQFIAQEMASLTQDKRFYLLSPAGHPGPERLAELARAFREAGEQRFLLIVALYAGSVDFPSEVSLEDAAAHWSGKLLGRFGDFYRIYEFERAFPRSGRQEQGELPR